MTSAVLLLQVGAAAASLFGYLLITRAGAFGGGEQIGAGEGVSLLLIAALHGWWLSPIAAATSGVRGAFLALVILDVVWAFLAQGVAGYAFCAIPCPSMAPWSDIQRFAALVLGAAAAWTAWRAYRAMAGPTQLAPAVTAAILVVLSFVAQGASFTPPGS